MTPLTLHIIQHSLGHTTSGKLILDFPGNISQFRTAHIKWTAKEHLEAHKILMEKLNKRIFDNESYDKMEITVIATIHYEEGLKKQERDEKRIQS